ncbi:E3 ubiquitin-protein ligase TRIM33-like [Mytilus edulis]|uniref:E3 ubiquitin-protein ligase TRIM33-like n=1 Tax=Mytilus edulis TaxID=6550 RepID=UPI0039EF5862
MAQAASPKCGSCFQIHEIYIVYFCIECENYYCEECNTAHTYQKVTRHHQTQKATDLIPGVKSVCSEHKEKFVLMCNTCNVQVCTSCVAENHNGHNFSKFVDVVSKLQEENGIKVRAKTNVANQNINEIENNLKSFENDVVSVIKAITNESSMIKRMIDTSVAEMIALVKDQSKKEKDNIDKIHHASYRVYIDGQDLDKSNRALDKTWPVWARIQRLNDLKEKIKKLDINVLSEFPTVSLNRKSVSEDDIRKLISTYTLR